MKQIFIVSLIYFLFTACEQPSKPEIRLKETGIPIPVGYKLLNFKAGSGIGESTEDYTLKISKEDYLKISKEIAHKTGFKLYNNAIGLPEVIDKTDMNSIHEIAYSYDDKYCYEIFKPDPGIIISVVLENDSLMSISYNDL